MSDMGVPGPGAGDLRARDLRLPVLHHDAARGTCGDNATPGRAVAQSGDMRGQRNPGPGRGAVASGRDLRVACRRVQTTTCSRFWSRRGQEP
jgi:hypothetical protein